MTVWSPDVLVYFCTNALPQGARPPRQWTHEGAHVVLHEVPCSGKMDGQYLLHALEGGARGLCVVACPKGQCRLCQGNYRAEIRIHTVQRLLGEAGLEPQRVELIHAMPEQSPDEFLLAIRGAAARICRLGPSALRAAQP
jgi:coenzyme F420-reducing hydrogenase delta subunit